MAAITWDDVIAIAPKLSTLPTGRQTTILAYVNTRIPAALWGGEDAPVLYEGRINLAAHMGTLAQRAAGGGAAAAGPITRVGEGDVVIDFANLAGGSSSSSLMLTTFGQEFRRLGRTTGARVMGVP